MKKDIQDELEKEKEKMIFRDYYCDENSKTSYVEGRITNWQEMGTSADTYHNYMTDK